MHYFTFCTVAVLAIAEYVTNLTRIDVVYFVHGYSGFSDHQIVGLCCCKCAVGRTAGKGIPNARVDRRKTSSRLLMTGVNPKKKP